MLLMKAASARGLHEQRFSCLSATPMFSDTLSIPAAEPAAVRCWTAGQAGDGWDGGSGTPCVLCSVWVRTGRTHQAAPEPGKQKLQSSSAGGWHIGNPKFGFLRTADRRASGDQKCGVVYSRSRIIFKDPASVHTLDCQEQREANAVAQLRITACIQSRSVGREGLVTHL